MVSGSYGYRGYCGYQWLSVVVHGFLILVVSGCA